MNAIARQALNTPIQGSAADFMLETMNLVSKALDKFKSGIVLQIHDELVFEIYDNELKKASKIIKEVMNREIELNGYRFRIPIDAEIGTFWGDLKGINLDTLELKGGSKH